MRAITSLLALLAAAALLASCGGGGGEDDGVDRGNGIAASCDPIAQIGSYRYSVDFRLQSPAAEATPAPSAPGQTPPAPFSAFADALTRLFSDFTLEGAYVAPDRSQAILRFQEEELELRAIGGKSWVRVGATWQEEQASASGLLTPEVICRDIVLEIAPSLGQAKSRPETVNGVQTQHYSLDETTLRELPAALGEQLPDTYAVELWLAQPGHWPVELRIESADVNEKGQPLGFRMSMDIRDLNDMGISIEPPVIPEAAQ